MTGWDHDVAAVYYQVTALISPHCSDVIIGNPAPLVGLLLLLIKQRQCYRLYEQEASQPSQEKYINP